MHLHDMILALVAFFSEVLGTLSGFGSSTFFVPIATLLETFRFVLALTALLHCFSNASKLYLFKEHIDKKLVLQFAVPSVILCGVGALLTSFISVEWLERALGMFLILFAAIKLFGRGVINLPTSASVGLSALSGFLTGFIGTGGALRGIALSSLDLPKNSFVVVSAVIDFGGDLLRAVVYLANGYMDWLQWFYIPLLLVAAFLGSRVGKFILGRMSQSQFEKIVAVFILLNGLVMVLKR